MWAAWAVLLSPLCLPLFFHHLAHPKAPFNLNHDDTRCSPHRQPLFFDLITATATTLHHHHPPLHIIIAAHHYWHSSSIIFRAIIIIIHCPQSTKLTFVSKKRLFFQYFFTKMTKTQCQIMSPNGM